MTLDIYTDGSCLGNPGIGGWAFIIKHEDGIVTRWANSQCTTTNNSMELTAALKALEYIQEHKIQDDIHIFTDSMFLLNGMSKWIHSWKKNNWNTSSGKTVVNESLWKALDNVVSQVSGSVKFIHVKAHANNEFNNKVDRLANEAAKNCIVSE